VRRCCWREHEKPGIREVLIEDDGVNWLNDDVFDAVNDQGCLPDFLNIT